MIGIESILICANKDEALCSTVHPQRLRTGPLGGRPLFCCMSFHCAVGGYEQQRALNEDNEDANWWCIHELTISQSGCGYWQQKLPTGLPSGNLLHSY